MKESKTINILITLSIFLALFGGFSLWQKGWVFEKASLRDVFISDSQEIGPASFWELIPQLAGLGEEKTYLLLLQNNLELRPSGGYLGTFGIIKIKNLKVVSFEMHDTNIFDGFGNIHTDPPQPIKDYLKIDNWQMRDGNWSPDFEISAKQVEYFYQAQGGQEEFDGIIGINATVLPEMLKFTGPIYLEEFDKEFKFEDVLYQLEYEVEKGYVERGYGAGERKAIFKALGQKLLSQLIKNGFWEQKELKDLVIRELNRKNIILFFKNDQIQKAISEFGWDGKVNQLYQNDYLMMIEANLASRKSNAFISRRVEYHLDLDKERPEASLKIIYTHKGEAKDWFNDDYRAYLRIYTPKGSWLLETNGVKDKTAFINELGKTVFGNWIEVPIGQEKVIEFKYLLPERVRQDASYKILVQKQIGIDSFVFKFVVRNNQKEYIEEKVIEQDWEAIAIFE